MFAHSPNVTKCGVAVLLARSMLAGCNVSMRFCDNAGRLIVLELDYAAFKIILFGIYAPTQKHVQLQISFLDMLRKQLDNLSAQEGPEIIMCGDFNLYLSHLDVHKGRDRLTQPSNALKSILSDFSLSDVWREKYNHRRRYTWRRLNPFQQSRIDCFH